MNAVVLTIRLGRLITILVLVTFSTVNYWTDSAVVFHYKQNAAERFTTVANRVAEIRENSNINQRRHVKCGKNPAELVSHGLCP